MNSPHYDMRLYTDLEKIVHAAHMQDIWAQAGEAYQNIIKVKSIEASCECVNILILTNSSCNSRFHNRASHYDKMG